MFECIQRCTSFEKFPMFLKVVLKVFVKCGFEKNRQACFCFASWQVTKSLSTPKFLKDLSYVFNPFNNFVPPLYLVDNIVLGCERDKRGSLFRP